MHAAPITLFAELRETGPVMLVGGTFDPPHLAHTMLANSARDAAALGAQMYFVPAARSPHKDAGPQASNEQRTEMLNLAITGFNETHVWTDEIDRASIAEPSYWVTTLERARSLLGTERSLYFLMGADQATSFDKWREPDRILELARVIVINRGDVRTQEELASQLVGTEFERTLVNAWCDVPSMEISATDIRQELTAKNESDLTGVLHSKIASYIKEHGLYQ